MFSLTRCGRGMLQTCLLLPFTSPFHISFFAQVADATVTITVPQIVVNLGPQTLTWTRTDTGNDPQIFQFQLRQLEGNGPSISQFFDGPTINSFGKATGEEQFIELIPPFNGDVGNNGAADGNYVVEVLNQDATAAIGESNQFRIVSNTSSIASSILSSISGSSTTSSSSSTANSPSSTTVTTSNTSNAVLSTSKATSSTTGAGSTIGESTTVGTNSADAPTRTTANDNASGSSSSNNKIGLIVGVVLGSVVTVLLLFLLLFFLFVRRRRRQQWRDEVEPALTVWAPSPFTAASPSNGWSNNTSFGSSKGISISQSNISPDGTGSGDLRLGSDSLRSESIIRSPTTIDSERSRGTGSSNLSRGRAAAETAMLRNEIAHLMRAVEDIRVQTQAPPQYS